MRLFIFHAAHPDVTQTHEPPVFPFTPMTLRLIHTHSYRLCYFSPPLSQCVAEAQCLLIMPLFTMDYSQMHCKRFDLAHTLTHASPRIHIWIPASLLLMWEPANMKDQK